MLTVINEHQLAATEVRSFYDVIAVKPGEMHGVEVFRARVLAQFASPEKEAPVNESRVLLIEVEDPDDQVVIDRLRLVCTEAWRR